MRPLAAARAANWGPAWDPAGRPGGPLARPKLWAQAWGDEGACPPGTAACPPCPPLPRGSGPCGAQVGARGTSITQPSGGLLKTPIYPWPAAFSCGLPIPIYIASPKPAGGALWLVQGPREKDSEQ